MPETLAKPLRPWALRLLPPFPAVASRVIALVNSDDSATTQISEIIRMDPSFTAEILRVANSALFGTTREIRSVALAVCRLGLDRLKAMATMVAINSIIKPALRIEGLRRFWIHSLVSAILTEESARACGGPVESAYTAGLLHDLGTLGLMAAYPEEYNRMLEVSRDYGFDLIQAERDLFEIDHCSAGTYLSEEWNFPEEIGVAIAKHHFDPVPGSKSVSGLVRVGWRLADVLGYGAFPPERPWTYEELIAAMPGANRSWLGAGIDETKEELAKRLTSLPL